MHGLQLSLWVVVVFHKVRTELSMPLTVRVSLLWRACSLNFWVRRMPLFHLVLKKSQLLFWNTLTQVMRKIKMWLSLTWPTSFTSLWVRNIFLLVGKNSRSFPFTKKALSLIPTTTSCWLWVGLWIDCTPSFWENWRPNGVLRTDKFLTRNFAFIQTVAQFSLCFF